MDFVVLNWNVRGLNNPAKRRAVQLFVAEQNCKIVCLQETKVGDMTRGLVLEALGPRFADNFISLPANGSRGGILIACCDDHEIIVEPLATGLHSVSGTVRSRANGMCWSINGVYGPQSEEDKVQFIEELKRIKQHMLPRWMVLGDFNMI